MRALAVTSALLLLAGVASMELAWAGYPSTFGLVELFDIDVEGSVPCYFSALMLLLASGLCALHAKALTHHATRNWWLLAVVFSVMSIDEIVGYHESWSGRLQNSFDTGGVFHFAWVVPAMVLVAVFALSQVQFLRTVAPSLAKGLLVAGAVYVGGALGMEMLGGLAVESLGTGDNRIYDGIVVVEEGLEMLGLVLLIRALLVAADNMRLHLSIVR